MNAWLFAGSLFVAILAFEFLMFRFVGRSVDGTKGAGTTGSTVGTDGGDVGGPGTAATGTQTATGDGSAADARVCGECGRPNDDSAMVQYCGHCLSRLH